MHASVIRVQDRHNSQTFDLDSLRYAACEAFLCAKLYINSSVIYLYFIIFSNYT